jgi:hypothetical protein
LLDTIESLDAHLREVLAALPSQRDLSYLEVTLFCLIAHLEFRDVLPMGGNANLTAFALVRRAKVRHAIRPTVSMPKPSMLCGA